MFGLPEFALAVIAVGVVTLAIAVLHYRRSLASLQKESGETYRSLAGTIANFVMALGGGLLIVVLFRK